MLDHRNNPQPKPDTHRSQPDIALFPVHDIEQGVGDAGARAAQRVAQSDGAAVEV